MNPWLLLAVVVGWGASVAGAGWFMYERGQDNCEAVKARENRVAAVATDAAASAAGAAIAKLRPKITTIRQEAEREIRTNTVYAECRHSPGQLERINEAITGAPFRPAAGSMPAAASSPIGNLPARSGR